MTTTQPQRQDWTAAWVAFVVALFAWGAGFYGLPMFVHTLHESRERSISLMSMAVTTHFLLSAILVANLPRVHHRLGATHTTLGGTGLLAAAHVGTAVALVTSINQAVFAFAPALSVSCATTLEVSQSPSRSPQVRNCARLLLCAAVGRHSASPKCKWPLARSLGGAFGS